MSQNQEKENKICKEGEIGKVTASVDSYRGLLRYCNSGMVREREREREREGEREREKEKERGRGRARERERERATPHPPLGHYVELEFILFNILKLKRFCAILAR